MPINNVRLGKNVAIPQPDLVNLFGCEIGDDTKIGAFVEIGRNVKVGARCKIGAQSFLCDGVTVEDEVFIGPAVTFINDRYPRATTNGRIQSDADWTIEPTVVKKGASIGAASVIMCGVTIGEGAMIAAGAVVTRDVAGGTTVAGVPTRLIRGVAAVAKKLTSRVKRVSKKPAKRAKKGKPRRK